MNWENVQRLPAYNPHQFEIATHLDGLTRGEVASRAGLKYHRYRAIEAGEVEPTAEEFESIFKAQKHVLRGFFQMWPKTTLEWDGICMARTVEINYYKYRVFRNINPPPLRTIS